MKKIKQLLPDLIIAQQTVSLFNVMMEKKCFPLERVENIFIPSRIEKLKNLPETENSERDNN